MRKLFLLARLLLIFLISGCNSQPSKPGNIHVNPNNPNVDTDTTTSISISQYGVTWYFDQAYASGRYANGDYWVSGDTVVITRITPDFDSVGDEHIHGWEINPVVEGKQGFATIAWGFDPNLVPDLPCTLTTPSSVVKSIRSDVDNRRGCLKTAAVLTVLQEIPEGQGKKLFRPPYVGTNKPSWKTSDLKTEELPSLESVRAAVTLAWVESSFVRVQLDHKVGALGRHLHPLENIPDYGSTIGTRNNNAVLRLMMNDPINEKMAALIAYVQYGIDLWHMYLIGHRWAHGGGYRPGQKIPLVFLAVIMGNEAVADSMRNADFFEEDIMLVYGENAGKALFGTPRDEKTYWEYIAGCPQKDTRQWADPYGYIDGGCPLDAYQECCLSQPFKGSALALHLMPKLKTVWNDSVFFNYVDRWVETGLWTQPDPCAPAKGEYGVDYGPDGNGGCIKDQDASDGIGRFSDLHGQYGDAGGYGSHYVNQLWDKYR